MNASSDTTLVLSQCLEEAATLSRIDPDACDRLADRLYSGIFNLVVAGEFKRGKSSVINALLGAVVLPVAVVPLTSVVTLIQHGEEARATVKFLGGEERDIALEAIVDYATEKGNPGNAKGVEHVCVAWPSPWLRGGIRLVDTPGIGSIHAHNTEVAYRYLPQADAVLFVASVDQPLGRAEADFLADIRRYADKVFCLLNKADLLSAEELRESLAFVTHAVQAALGTPVPVIPVSARWMLAGQHGDAERLAQSGLQELESVLHHLLGEERRTVWLDSMARNLWRLLAQTRLATELELKALTAPIEEIDAKLAAFLQKKAETEQALADYEILFEAGTKKLLKDKVEPELENFRARLKPELMARIDRHYETVKDLPARPLQAALEEYAINEVRTAYDDWRAAEDTVVARDFQALCERFWGNIRMIVDELSRYSAELFSVSFETIRANTPWRPQTDFYYKFWSEPGALSQIGTSFVLLLPMVIGGPLIRERGKKCATELADTQAGRVRYNFEERLKKSALDFRRELRAGMAATIAGIEAAVARGREMRQHSASDLAARRDHLTQSVAKIDLIEARLRRLSTPNPKT